MSRLALLTYVSDPVVKLDYHRVHSTRPRSLDSGEDVWISQNHHECECSGVVLETELVELYDRVWLANPKVQLRLAIGLVEHRHRLRRKRAHA